MGENNYAGKEVLTPVAAISQTFNWDQNEENVDQHVLALKELDGQQWFRAARATRTTNQTAAHNYFITASAVFYMVLERCISSHNNFYNVHVILQACVFALVICVERATTGSSVDAGPQDK